MYYSGNSQLPKKKVFELSFSSFRNKNDFNLHLFTRINTKLTTSPITWSCVNKKEK